MIMVIVLVLIFGSSSKLAAAYGIAVTGAMFIDTLLWAAVLISLWHWPLWKALPLVAAFFVGAFVGVALMVLGRAGRKTAIPFGPFMFVGAITALLFTAPLMRRLAAI
mgnify:CR=1 FL=1